MTKYLPGKQTKEKILYCAKELFWEKGYNNTTLQNITKEAGIRQSLLFYYFENKFVLAEEIFNKFSETSDHLLCKKLQENGMKLSITLERCLYVACYYRLTLDNSPLARFLAEINEGYIMMRSPFVKKRYEMLLEENHQALDEDPFEMIMLGNLSNNSLLFTAHFDGVINNSNDEIITFKIKQLLRSLYIDMPKVREYMNKTMELEKKFRFEINSQFDVTYQEE